MRVTNYVGIARLSLLQEVNKNSSYRYNHTGGVKDVLNTWGFVASYKMRAVTPDYNTSPWVLTLASLSSKRVIKKLKWLL